MGKLSVGDCVIASGPDSIAVDDVRLRAQLWRTGEYLYVGDDGVISAPASGGGGGGGTGLYRVWDPMAPPEVPDELDDEFDSGQLTGWTVYDPEGRLSFSFHSGALVIAAAPRSSHGQFGVLKPVPSGQFYCATRVSAVAPVTNWWGAGMLLFENLGGGRVIRFGVSTNTDGQHVGVVWFSSPTGGWYQARQLNAGVPSGSAIFLRARFFGSSDIGFDVSADGRSWQELWSGNVGFGVSYVGLGTDNLTSTRTIWLRCEFFRVRRCSAATQLDSPLFGRERML